MSTTENGVVGYHGYYTWFEQNSRDHGKTYKNETNHFLFRLSFQRTSNIVNDERVASNILDIMAYVGGLELFVFMFFEKIGRFVNSKKIQTKFIRNLYFEGQQGNTIRAFFFKTCNLLGVHKTQKLTVNIGTTTFVKEYLRSMDCRRKKNRGRDERLFEQGVEKLNRDLSFIGVVESIRKLKACCQVMMKVD